MHSYYNDQDKVDFNPEKNSIAAFVIILLEVIGKNRDIIYNQLSQTLKEYQALVVDGNENAKLEMIKYDKGYTAKYIIESLEKLDANEIEWAGAGR